MSSVLARVRADLVERRLWPIALLLLLALVAVPLLLTHSAPAPPPTPQVTPSPAAASAVSAAERAVSAKPRATPAGPARDPFPGGASTTPSPGATATASGAHGSSSSSSHAAPSSGSASISGGSSSSSSASSSSPSTGSSAPSSSNSSPSPAGSTPPAPATVTPAPRPPATARSKPAHRAAPERWTIRYVDLRIGAEPHPALRRGVARLAPLPSGRAPLALLLGVLRDGRSVAFRIAQGVTVSGPGRCVPGRSVCTQLVLRPGQHADLTPAGGTALRLRVVAVRSAKTTSRARARQAYARVSPTGRCILDTLDAFDYDARTGALHRAGPRHRCRYAAPAGGTAEALRVTR